MINTEEQDHTCEFCYYEFFDDKAYPCSRCVCNQPTENMWRAKDESQTEVDVARAIVHKMIDNSELAEDAYPDLRQRLHEAIDEYEPQERSE